MSKPAWRIYYDNHATFDSTQGEPHEAPGLGVVCIVQPDETTGRSIMARWDWYVWREDTRTWWGHDTFGLLDQLTNDRANAVRAVKAGRTVSTPEYQRTYKAADADADFAPRSARNVSERVA